MTTNSNEATAPYYDLLYSTLRPSDLTDAEISLINFLVEPGASILDLGGGTGRHATILSKLNYKMTVLDSSKAMIDELRKKDPKIKAINKNIYRAKLTQKYDLIILMWNTFNEISSTKKDARLLLKKLKKNLTSNGSILINIDDSTKVDPKNFNFEVNKQNGNLRLEGKWNTYQYNRNTNTSISKEAINFYVNDTLIDTKISFIKQRYWSLKELTKLAAECNFKVESKQIKGVTDLYIILK